MTAQMGSVTGSWVVTLCRSPICSDPDVASCALNQIFDSSTCMNHLVEIGIAVLFLVVLALQLIVKFLMSRSPERQLVTPSFSSPLHLAAVASNGGLGLLYLGLGLWMLENNFSQDAAVYMPHWWLLTLSQGLNLILASFAFSISTQLLGAAFGRFWSVLLTIYAAFICCSSVFYIVSEKTVTIKACLDVLSLPGATLFLIYGFQHSHNEEGDGGLGNGLYEPLNTGTDGEAANYESQVTPFAKAGYFSEMSFWWLNPLLKMGYEKPLEDKDMPLLATTDRAHNQYMMFMEKLNGKKQSASQATLIFWTIVSCHKRAILVSGFFALLKVLTLSAGPMLLKAFIDVSLGKGTFRYEGCLLAVTLFVCKFCESLSQRQWYFRTRRLGLQVRSFLSAAIYKKQQKLSNAAKMTHSSGEIMNYVTVDAYRIGEFPYWFHQTWTTSVQICIALAILYNAVGAAVISALVVIIITVLCNAPLAKLQHKFQSKLMKAQDVRLKAMSESLVHMKVLKLYAWEAHFKKVIEGLREVEYKWLHAFQLGRTYNGFLFWASPAVVSAATFLTCYVLKIPLDATNVFTFVATLRLVQDPISTIPDVIAVVIQAKVAFTRISKFLVAPELNGQVRKKYYAGMDYPLAINSCSFSWDENTSKPILKNINLLVKAGQKIAICGEVGSGKSTLLAAVLGEVPKIEGTIQVCGKIAYVSQTAWIQTGTVQDNILFGSLMDRQRYEETLERCSLVKDLEILPFGDRTQIGERGVNLSGGQKQRVQLARALYQNADIYLLDDPFSAVDAHTATSLFNEYVMSALSDKTVVLVTHQVDFLPVFDSILLMSDGEVIRSAPYQDLLANCQDFKDLVNSHTDIIGLSDVNNNRPTHNAKEVSIKVIDGIHGRRYTESVKPSPADQLIKKEERETGDTGFEPYMLYLRQNKGFLYFSFAMISHMIFIAGQILQNSWMAANVQNPDVSTLKLISVYIIIGVSTLFFLLSRSLSIVVLGMHTSRSLFSQLLNSLFRAPMSFFDSTPLGRILSRVSSDLSIVDLDVPFTFVIAVGVGFYAYSNLGVLVVVTWEVLFVSVPMMVLAVRVQRYYLASAKELMRINGTTKSALANHIGESISGTVTIRAFEEQDRFFAKILDLVDKNASPYFYNFAATEWLIQRLEIMTAAVLSFSALVLAILPQGSFSPGVVGMALSYGLTLNMTFVYAIQNQCNLANQIISVERLNQYMDIQSEAAEIVEENRPSPDWPQDGNVELRNLKVKYRKDAPLVLHGITCKFEGGDKIGIVGRTGSGKTTLIGAFFRLVEPAEGKIIIDSVDISTIGLHDLRSRLGIIPQDPTLFQGTVRYNLDPLGQFSDQQIWEVLEKCQLTEAVQEKEHGLDSHVMEDGSNWSMGQRQLFCLGRALLRKCRILVLDEATASIDNATDAVLQTTIRTEFKYCTVITVAHRIPTVMDCDMVLAMSDGRVMEFDKPTKLMETEGSLFRELVKEYWSHTSNTNI